MMEYQKLETSFKFLMAKWGLYVSDPQYSVPMREGLTILNHKIFSNGFTTFRPE